MEDGRVEITFKTPATEIKKLDNETVIGDYYNMTVNYIKDKETCVEDLTDKLNKYSEDLASIDKQLSSIEINDTLADELKQIVEISTDIFKSIREIKDFSNEKFVSENPKKFGKMLRDCRLLKENAIGEIKEIDTIIGLHKRKTELLGQQKQYSTEVGKIREQLEEVKNL